MICNLNLHGLLPTSIISAVSKAVVFAGFISLLGSPYSFSCGQKIVWALGNIADDGPELRDDITEPFDYFSIE